VRPEGLLEISLLAMPQSCMFIRCQYAYPRRGGHQCTAERTMHRPAVSILSESLRKTRQIANVDETGCRGMQKLNENDLSSFLGTRRAQNAGTPRFQKENSAGQPVSAWSARPTYQTPPAFPHETDLHKYITQKNCTCLQHLYCTRVRYSMSYN
jgi:hypothetical protein